MQVHSRAFAVVVLLTLAILASCLVPREASAAVPMWGTVPPQPGTNVPTFFPDPKSACKFQRDHYSPPSTLYGYTPVPGYFGQDHCEWNQIIGYSLPTNVNLECTDGHGNRDYSKKLVPPGTCVDVYEPVVSRPASCSYNSGATPNPTVQDPVVLSNGALYETTIDYADADGRLLIRRTYRSKTGSDQSAFYGALAPYGLGDLWRLSFQWELALQPSFFGSMHGVVVGAPDGSNYTFALNSNGSVSEQNHGINDVSLQYVNPGGAVSYSGILTNGGQFIIKTSSGDQILMELFVPYWATNLPASQRYIAGRPLQITYRGGYTWSFTYSQGQLQSITDSLGRSMSFSWYSSTVFDAVTVYPRAIQTITMPDGTTLNYGYNSYTGDQTENDRYTRLTTFSRTKNGVTVDSSTYLYADPSSAVLLTGAIDNAGVQFGTWQYDSAGRVISASHPGGADGATFAYSLSGSSTAIRTVTDAIGEQTVYTFALGGAFQEPRLTSIVGNASQNCVGTTQSLTYDSSNRKITSVDALGNTTKYVYGAADGRVQTMTEAFGAPTQRVTQYTWNSFGLPTQVIKPGLTINISYDTAGRVLQRQEVDTTSGSTNGQTRTWSYTYYASGLVASVDGPLAGSSDSTLFSYNSLGYRSGVTDPLGHVTQTTSLDGAGRPLSITDANGSVITRTYDSAGRPSSRQVNGETTALTYWPTGLIKRVTLPDGSYLQYTYDDARRLIETRDGLGNRIAYTLDALGNRTAEQVYDPSSALARTHTRVFDALGRLYKDINAAGTAAVTTTRNYDGNDNLTTVAAPLARSTSYGYDALNRQKQITDPGSGITTLGYNARDNVTLVTDPRNLSTAYTHDAFGDVIQKTSPDTGTTNATYDSAGNLATRTDARGKTGTFSFDALRRVTSITYPDLTTNFTYDSGINGVGRWTGASDANHSLNLAYDALGRVISKTQTVGSVSKTVGYGYTNGNRTTLITPSGQTITYGYTEGRKTSITLNGSTTILDQVLYEPFGPTSGWRWGNGTYAARVYNLDGKTVSIDSAGASNYGVDDAGRVTAVTDLVDSTKSWTHGYDTRDRLNSSSRTGQTIGYTYDANGNRLSQTGTQAATYTNSSTSNRVNSISGTPTRTYSYDAAGNTTGDGTNTYTYNDAGRQSTVTRNGVTTTSIYNALGQRVKKSNSSGTRYFVHDEAGHMLGEYDTTGGLIQETVWLDDVPVATLRPNGSGGVSVYYVHTDHLNTPRRISRPSDNVIVWRWDSDPFGTTAPNEDPDGDSVTFAFNLRFPGQYFDVESGTHYNYFRDYDPALGRYIESDPIGLSGGINTYAYVRNQPVRFIDRFGLQESADNPDRGPEDIKPDSGLGLGEFGEKACDFEQDRKDAEQELIEAKLAGDKEKQKRLQDKIDELIGKMAKSIEKSAGRQSRVEPTPDQLRSSGSGGNGAPSPSPTTPPEPPSDEP